MTTSFKNKFTQIKQDNLKSNYETQKRNMEKSQGENVQNSKHEDPLQKEIDLVMDPIDTAIEIKKNEINLGPIDTPAELKARGLDKKNADNEENEKVSPNFMP